jgi:hypothetical protein
VPKHGFAGNLAQRLARQARGGKARGNDGENAHDDICNLKFENLKLNNWGVRTG